MIADGTSTITAEFGPGRTTTTTRRCSLRAAWAWPARRFLDGRRGPQPGVVPCLRVAPKVRPLAPPAEVEPLGASAGSHYQAASGPPGRAGGPITTPTMTGVQMQMVAAR